MAVKIMRIKFRLLHGLLVSTLAVMSGINLAADLDRELRIKDEIIEAILDGDPIELNANGHEFLGIYMESESDSLKGAALIMHGRGFHPDWVDTVQPLRTGLTEHGWNTLSIQMPVLHKEAKYYDYIPVFPEAGPRIEAAIRYLKEQGNERIVLIAHSCSVHMSQHWVNARADDVVSTFDAYIGLGMGATDYKQPMKEPYSLDKMPMPVLDVHGGNDYPAVKRMLPERKAMMRHPKSEQRMVEEADHYYTNKGDELLEVVKDWLDKVF